MKRFIGFGILFAFLCTAWSGGAVSGAERDNQIVLTIDSPAAWVNEVKTAVDVDETVIPFISGGTTMVPIRFLAEHMGWKVQWSAVFRTAVLTAAALDSEIKLTEGSATAFVNGEEIMIDEPACVVGSRLFVPVRFVGEQLSCSVEWDERTSSVRIRQEHAVDVNDEQVQALYQTGLRGDALQVFYEGVTDVSLLDNEQNIIGGYMRELLAVLRLPLERRQYSNEEADEILRQCLTAVDSSEESQLGYLKAAVERGHKYGVDAPDEKLVAVVGREELDPYAEELFGGPLPAGKSHAYSVGLGNLFLYSRTNLLPVEAVMPAYVLYYNEENEKWLFLDLSDPLEVTNTNELLKSETSLIKATRHNDELSLYLAHSGEYHEYSGNAIGSYQGVYKNTYRKKGDRYYWVSSYGTGEMAS